MKILNETEKGEIGITFLEEEWLSPDELEKLEEIRKSGCEIRE